MCTINNETNLWFLISLILYMMCSLCRYVCSFIVAYKYLFLSRVRICLWFLCCAKALGNVQRNIMFWYFSCGWLDILHCSRYAVRCRVVTITCSILSLTITLVIVLFSVNFILNMVISFFLLLFLYSISLNDLIGGFILWNCLIFWLALYSFWPY